MFKYVGIVEFLFSVSLAKLSSKKSFVSYSQKIEAYATAKITFLHYFEKSALFYVNIFTFDVLWI